MNGSLNTANWVITYHLPPIKGTRNSYWSKILMHCGTYFLVTIILHWSSSSSSSSSWWVPVPAGMSVISSMSHFPAATTWFTNLHPNNQHPKHPHINIIIIIIIIIIIGHPLWPRIASTNSLKVGRSSGASDKVPSVPKRCRGGEGNPRIRFLVKKNTGFILEVQKTKQRMVWYGWYRNKRFPILSMGPSQTWSNWTKPGFKFNTVVGLATHQSLNLEPHIMPRLPPKT